MATLTEHCPELCRPTTRTYAQNSNELNLLNINDLTDNWSCLSPIARYQLSLFADADWTQTEWIESGLKGAVTAASTILLLIGLEVSNTWPAGDALIRSNLITNSHLPNQSRQTSHLLDPKAARRRYREFKKMYAPETLFPKHDAYVVHFKSPPWFHSLNHRSCNASWQFDLSILFQTNNRILQRWKKTKLITAYFSTHEISCRSIRNQTFVPHTHAIVWMPRGQNPSFINEYFSQGIQVEYIPEPKKTWPEIKRVVRHLLNSTSLVRPYQLEFRDEDRVSFNIQAKKALRTLIELYYGHRSCYDEVVPAEPEGAHSIISTSGTRKILRIREKKLNHQGIPKRSPRSSTRKKTSNKSPARSRTTTSTSKPAGRSKPKSSPKDKS